ncbi:TonB-dependent receptor [Wenzhouxiangella sp. AB-CW3]|uniref:TonB-dependent receptor plug domain-containing protein n=1 Tax=Wenzhouxiangella sp. AB-CW3 TaxID=2771012 RepID=UPI00168ABCC3|nr:TonB-dependent receptor [Wenzhouxiangella sp. AB-CW3]QOC22829.1 TonB-dependent receptor [Wenzhouxiangella sp. AB-CW3]
MKLYKRNSLTESVRLALGVGLIATAMATGGSVWAQDTDDDGDLDDIIDRIAVTGTRVVSPGLLSSSPITSIDDSELQFRQSASIEDVIRELPVAVPALGPGTNNGTGGGSTVNLRGLGSNRNLVLINGRRIVPFNLTGQVDTNIVPVALLERADLVTGGASAVYGADAVSGVLNFVMRSDFEGVELSSFYGMSEKGDADRTRTDFIVGANTSDGRGNVTMALSYTDIEPLTMGERDIGEFSLFSDTGQPGGSSAGVPTFSLVELVEGEGSVLAQWDPDQGRFTDDLQLYNYNPTNFYQGALERTQATALARYEIIPEVEAYGEFIYMDNTRRAQLAPSGTFFNNWNVPIGNPFLTDEGRAQICATHDIAPEDCVAGSTEEVTMQARRRMTELGPRLNDFENDVYQYTVGARGDIGINWTYDAYWSQGQASQVQTQGNWGSNSRVQQALRAVEVDECLDDSNNCVPLNLFGPEGSITDEMIDFINLSSLSTQTVDQEVGALTFAGDLGDIRSPMADEPIGVAVGAEYRRVAAATLSDQASQIQGEVLGTGAPTPDRSGAFTLREVYAEMIAPIVQGVTFEGGYRYTDFSVADESSTSYDTWKAGLNWEATDELLVRGMVQRATRAPNVNELFAPQVSGLSNLGTDPCQGDRINQDEAGTPGTLSNLCVQTGVPTGVVGNLPSPAAGQINVLSGGNPELGPEEADTWTAGVVWQPFFVDDLTVTVDYYRIEIEDQISSPSSTDLLEQCYDPALNPGFEFNEACSLILRSPTGGDLNASDALGVVTALSNSGRSKTEGIDLGVNYGMPLPNDMGDLSFTLNLTRVLNWEFQDSPASSARDCLGYYSVACNEATGAGLIHETRFNQRTTWTRGDYDVSLNWRYMSGLDVEPGSGDWLDDFSSISSFSYFDLSGAWRINENVRLNATINNLFDKSAPNVGDTIGSTAANSGNTFPQFYDVLGRFYTLGVNVSF